MVKTSDKIKHQQLMFLKPQNFKILPKDIQHAWLINAKITLTEKKRTKKEKEFIQQKVLLFFTCKKKILYKLIITIIIIIIVMIIIY